MDPCTDCTDRTHTGHDTYLSGQGPRIFYLSPHTLQRLRCSADAAAGVSHFTPHMREPSFRHSLIMVGLFLSHVCTARLVFTAFTHQRQKNLISSVEDAMGDRIRLFDLLARPFHAEVTMAGVWADLLWCGASICIRYTTFYQKQTNLEIVEIGYLKLVCVRVRQRAVDCDVRYASAPLPDASRIRHCVTCWGLGRRGRLVAQV
jgi:hypothetical protein